MKTKQQHLIPLIMVWAMLISVTPCISQNGVGINSTGAPADPSSMLDVSSTIKGFLPSRMTGDERNNIVNPATGLIVWCSNCGTNGGELQAFNGSSWTNLAGAAAAVPAIGQVYQGGKVAYILQLGDPGYDANVPHGLIAEPGDESSGIIWHATTTVTGATGTAVGTGNSNTNAIIALYGIENNAAKICYDLVFNGKSDWYLPSKDELDKLYQNKTAIGGFTNDSYWSSTEYNSVSGSEAVNESFNGGAQNAISKNVLFRVRAVRTF